MRDYVGGGSLVTVSFEWDQWPKRTVISMYSTNSKVAEAWTHDMSKALRDRFGEDSIQDKNKK